jgi:hypothetical protein
LVVLKFVDKKYCVILNPPESPFEKNNCISKLVLCQRGTSLERSWLVGKKGNIEASPTLIAKHEAVENY